VIRLAARRGRRPTPRGVRASSDARRSNARSAAASSCCIRGRPRPSGRRRGRRPLPRGPLDALIGDRGYDSDALDERLMTQYGIEMIPLAFARSQA